MPYITAEERDALAKGEPIASWGQLNYVITHLILDTIYKSGASYDTYQSVIGLLECIKLELYRRQMTPYEELKMEINGDVIPKSAMEVINDEDAESAPVVSGTPVSEDE